MARHQRHSDPLALTQLLVAYQVVRAGLARPGGPRPRPQSPRRRSADPSPRRLIRAAPGRPTHIRTATSAITCRGSVASRDGRVRRETIAPSRPAGRAPASSANASGQSIWSVDRLADEARDRGHDHDPQARPDRDPERDPDDVEQDRDEDERATGADHPGQESDSGPAARRRVPDRRSAGPPSRERCDGGGRASSAAATNAIVAKMASRTRPDTIEEKSAPRKEQDARLPPTTISSDRSTRRS